MSILRGLGEGFKHAIENPFGLDFEIHQGRIYIPFGSALNALGYNDFLERIIGVARITIAVIALAISENKKDRLIAGGHLIRGVLEMAGSFELCLLIADTAFTLFNLGKKLIVKSEPASNSLLPPTKKNEPAVAI